MSHSSPLGRAPHQEFNICRNKFIRFSFPNIMKTFNVASQARTKSGEGGAKPPSSPLGFEMNKWYWMYCKWAVLFSDAHRRDGWKKLQRDEKNTFGGVNIFLPAGTTRIKLLKSKIILWILSYFLPVRSSSWNVEKVTNRKYKYQRSAIHNYNFDPVW